jgi:WD40 repeat protein
MRKEEIAFSLLSIFLLFVGIISAEEKVEIIIQTGHNADVKAVAFTSDGRYIISGSRDNTIRLWESDKGIQVRIFEGHTVSVNSIAISMDDKYIVSGGQDTTIRLWEKDSGKLIKTFKGHNNYVTSVAISPDQKYIVSGSQDKTMRLWSMKLGKEIRRFRKIKDVVESVDFSPNSKLIASAGRDGVIRLWDIDSEMPKSDFKASNDRVNSVAFSPNGKFIACGSDDNKIHLWEVNAAREIKTLKGHTERILSVLFSNDGKYIVSGSYDKTVRVWDIKTEKEIQLFDKHTDGVNTVAFSPDGRYIVSGGNDNTIRVWETDSGNEKIKLEGHTDYVSSLAFSPDSRYFVSGNFDNTVRLWDMWTGKQIKISDKDEGHRDHVNAVTFTSRGDKIVSASSDKTIIIWDKKLAKQRKLKGHKKLGIKSIAISPNDSRMASGTFKRGPIRMWDMKKYKNRGVLRGHGGQVNSIAFSLDGQYLVSASSDQTIFLWETETGKFRRIVKHTNDVNSAAFGPDGKYIVSGSSDQTIRLWETKTGIEKRRDFKDEIGMGKIKSVSISRCGRYVITGSDDSIVRIWEKGTGKLIKRLKGHSQCVNAVAVSPDDKYIISGGRDGKINIWDFQKQSLLATAIPFKDRQWVVYTPFNYYISSSDGDKYIKFKKDNKLYNYEEYSETYNRGDMVAKILKGKELIDIGEHPDGTYRIVFETEVPKQLTKSKKLLVNGKKVTVSDIDQNAKCIEVMTLGDDRYEKIVKKGLNYICLAGSQLKREYLFWKEKGKLKPFRNPYKNSHAILVAIDDYDRVKDPQKRGKTGFKPLDYMINNAEELKKVLANIGFPPKNIQTLYDYNATSNNIENALKKFWKGGELAVADRLFFYFCGHGHVEKEKGKKESEKGYLVTYDFDSQKPALTSIPMLDLTTRHSREVIAHHMIIALDSCYSGLALPKNLERQPNEEELKEFQALSIIRCYTEPKARNVIFASRGDQAAFSLNGGVFTKYLIRGLKGGADYTNDKIIYFDELAFYVQGNVIAETSKYGRRQEPEYFPLRGYGEGKVVFLITE